MIMPLAFMFLPFGADWILIIVVGLLAFAAQMRVSAAFERYSRRRARSGVTGADAARQILDEAGIHDVNIEVSDGFLGDHYDPVHKKLVLSRRVAQSDSVAALGVAAHECAHAIQHKAAYLPLKARMAVVPITMFAANVLIPIVFFGGLLFHFAGPFFFLVDVAIMAYGILTIFQLITLPVEFDASRRAKIILTHMGMINEEEAPAVSDMLGAAAWTYVAAFVMTLVWLLHFIALRGSHHE